MSTNGERWTAVYVRVSSRKQETRSQLPDLKRWVAAFVSEGDRAEWYEDKATGKTMDRPEWKRLWSDLVAGHVSRIVVWRLDRLGRTTPELSQLFADLTRRGVDLVSMREGIELSTPAGRLMANVLASVAQYETEVRGERVAAGIAAAKGRGVTFGRPKGSARPTKFTPELVATARALRAQGMKVARIARQLKVSRSRLVEMLAAES